MRVMDRWRKEPGARIEGSRDLDSSKLQAPCIVRNPSGGYRLFYTAVGPAKPYPICQGYILSAVSEDGLLFRKEPDIRLAPRQDTLHVSLRVLAPSVTQLPDGCWRMYFEARGSADRPTVICSAVSSDMVEWDHEEGIRLQGSDGFGGPRYLSLPDGRGRIYCFRRLANSVVSAVTSDGLNFELEPGYRMRDKQETYDTVGITAAEVIPPSGNGDDWTMLFSAWQDAPPGTVVPTHPSQDVDAVANGLSKDFAAASIAADMAGFRSRIFVAHSPDGLNWQRAGCAIEGSGYDGDDLDAVHAEDMSLIRLDDGRYRMYYAACDRHGVWRIASAVTDDTADKRG
jgi:hypothetical protein